MSLVLAALAEVSTHKLKASGLVGCVFLPLAALAWAPTAGLVWLAFLLSPALAAMLFVVILLQSLDPEIDPME